MTRPQPRLRILLFCVLTFGGPAAAQVVYPANGHTYVLTPIVSGVQEAREWAARRGGYLAAVNDAAEQSFLVTNFHVPFQPRWIGLSDEGTEGVWRWDSGEPVTTTNWCPGEPNNSGNEDHVELGTTISSSPCWNDAPATYTGFNAQRGIVEIPAGTQTEFRKVMITEVTWGTPDGLEITNFAATPADLSLHTVQWRDGTTLHTSSPLGITAAPGEVFTVGADPNPFPAGMPGVRHLPRFTTLSGGTAGLVVEILNGSGVVVDTVLVSNSVGQDEGLAYGGVFRGIVSRPGVPVAGEAGVERVWGLDTDSAGDWTAQPNRSLGYRNRSSGSGSPDPVPSYPVVINEFDPDYLEIRNTSGGILDLQGWFLSSNSALLSGDAVLIQPFGSSTLLADQAHLVIGDESRGPPAELPAGVAYVATPAAFRHDISSSEIVLYDRFGRVIDVVRTSGVDDQMEFSIAEPAPAPWQEFRGSVLRSSAGTLGRTGATDTGQGSDWSELRTRTLGSANDAPIGLPGHATDVHLIARRLSVGPGSGAVILNAGSSHAFEPYGQFLSVNQQSLGTGPFFGLGPDALGYFFAFFGLPPVFGFLDAQGSAGYAWPAGVFPGVQVELIFFIWNPATAAFHRTLVHVYRG